MTHNDYSDEEDFYSQGFERKGIVSVWAGLKDRSGEPEVDTLQDLCGVGYYNLSDQESNCFNFEEVDLGVLMKDLSYSASFLGASLRAAKEKGIERARWVTVQYDFDYSPDKVKRAIADDPVFVGSFPYMDGE